MCLTFSDYINSKYVYDYEYKNRKRRKKEREGHTAMHGGDTGYIPLGDIFIKGILVVEH